MPKRIAIFVIGILLGAIIAVAVRPPSIAREGGEPERVNAALDAFHAAAASADFDDYFGLMTPDAVFIGTDPAERWTRAEFEAYARPFFQAGQGWTYTPIARRVEFAPVPVVAWFDEDLRSEKYGLCRGTGVLLRQNGEWRIAHYALTKPIPNDLFVEIVERIESPQPAAPE